jgi:chaperonin GroEL (HSP60 family)
MSRLAKATGATVVSNFDDLTPKDLGFAKTVDERKIETDRWTFIEGCKNPKAVTILVTGGSQRVVDEAERSVHDALMVSKDVLEKPFIVSGGGSPEAYMAMSVRKWSNTLSGREQLAAEKYAEALEVIPLSLAENAGMNVIDALADIHAKQSKGSHSIGIDARNAKVADMSKLDIVEPLAVKEQIIKSATEVACMILRIDDIVASSRSSGASTMSPGE